MDESNLTRLTYTFSICEPSGAEQLGGLVYGVIEAKIDQQTTCSRPCSTFSRVAVNNNDIFGISYIKNIMLH